MSLVIRALGDTVGVIKPTILTHSNQRRPPPYAEGMHSRARFLARESRGLSTGWYRGRGVMTKVIRHGIPAAHAYFHGARMHALGGAEFLSCVGAFYHGLRRGRALGACISAVQAYAADIQLKDIRPSGEIAPLFTFLTTEDALDYYDPVKKWPAGYYGTA